MSSHKNIHGLLRHASLSVMALMMLGFSTVLIQEHVSVVYDIRQYAIPMVATLPELEQRIAVLEEQVELTELQSALRVGSQEERMKMFVLPTAIDTDRIIGIVDVISAVLLQKGMISQANSISFGQKTNDGLLRRQSVLLEYTISRDGLQELLQIVDLSGILTLADVLTDDERTQMFELVERKNPAAIADIEEFLAIDLMEYAADSRSHDERFSRAFSDDSLRNSLVNIVQSSDLKHYRALLSGPLGKILADQQLWPMPLMTLNSIDLVSGRAAGWYTATMSISLYERSL